MHCDSGNLILELQFDCLQLGRVTAREILCQDTLRKIFRLLIHIWIGSVLSLSSSLSFVSLSRNTKSNQPAASSSLIFPKLSKVLYTESINPPATDESKESNAFISKFELPGEALVTREKLG